MNLGQLMKSLFKFNQLEPTLVILVPLTALSALLATPSVVFQRFMTHDNEIPLPHQVFLTWSCSYLNQTLFIFISLETCCKHCNFE